MPFTVALTRHALAVMLCALLCATVVLSGPPGASAAEDDARTVSVTGTGIVKARPDMANISTGVVTEAKTADEALKANTASMRRVVDELKQQGIESKDIQTSDFSVQPRYQHFKDGKPPEITGYRVSNTVGITVRYLEKLGAILDKVVTLGSNQIGGIQFTVSDAGKLKDMARKDAMDDATRKAKIYAAAAGAELGKIKSISESHTSSPPRPYRARIAARAQSAPVPIEAGEQALEVRVNVTWELD